MIGEIYQIPYVLGVIALMIIFLIIDKIKVSLVFLFGIALLIMGGSLAPQTFISGLSNTSILTIFLLIIITSSINNHFNLSLIFDRLFGETRSLRFFILKMSVSVTGVSAFMNNTPVVAMLMPYMYTWGKKNNVSPSKLLIPLSYAAIAGGMITLIGTSTNLVLNGLIVERGMEPLGMFDFVVPGLLVAVSSITFLVLLSSFILKDQKNLLKVFEENTREYLIEASVSTDSEIIGKTVEEAGLRNLKGVFLAEIIRENRFITPISPDMRIEPADILLFAGETNQIFELFNERRGLELSKKKKFDIADNPDLYEAVIAQNSSLDHKTAKEIGFRDKFDGAIVGIHRRGEKLSGKIGSMELHTGDLLLISGGKNFQNRRAVKEDLIVVNSIPSTRQLPFYVKSGFILGSILSILLAAFGVISLFESLLIMGFILLLLGMTDLDEIRDSISFDLLIILISALAIGQVLIETQAAETITSVVFSGAENWSPLWVLTVVFGVTFLLTSFITNVAAISIIFPVVYTLAIHTSLSHEALFLTAAFAASCCFATPFAYQTNLMVMEAGNYRFLDFLKMGLPLGLLYALVFLSWAAVNYKLI